LPRGDAGILDGMPATSHWVGLSALKTLGAQPRGEEQIAHDGKILTAAGVPTEFVRRRLGKR